MGTKFNLLLKKTFNIFWKERKDVYLCRPVIMERVLADSENSEDERLNEEMRIARE